MKRIVSVILAAVIALGVLASCSSSLPTGSSSSAAGDSYRAWLESRGVDTTDIMIGTADDAQSYNVDLSSFEREGYVIRRIDGKAAIFAKTDAGLDRAVRAYAKHAADGNFETTYGDGQPKFGRIILAGYDIAEYTIVIPADASSCVKFAAENLRDYTKKACGAKLAISNESAEHNIAFVLDNDLHEQGFVIETTDGRMTIRHGWSSGALNGAMTFLEKYEGWRFLYTAANSNIGANGAIDYVYPADTVEIPTGIDHAEEPALFSRDIYGGIMDSAGVAWGYKIKYNGQGVGGREGNINRQSKACHGLTTNFWLGGDYPTLRELNETSSGAFCFTDDYTIELIETAVCKCIDDYIAVGQRPICIDIANADTGSYCECKNCLALVNKEGARSALILNYANAVARTVAEKYGDDIYVSILAYFGTSKPPHTMLPEKNVHVSYCFYVDIGMTQKGSACGVHPFDGSGCDKGKYNDAVSKEFERWCEIATVVDVWTYGDDYHATAFGNPFTTTMDNVRYIAQCGAYGSFWMGGNLLNMALWQYLVAKAHWSPYQTHDEMWDDAREYCNIVYGADCGDYVCELLRMYDDAATQVPCYLMLQPPKATVKYNIDYYLAHREEMTDLFERAIANAPTTALENQIKFMRCYFEIALVRDCWDEYSNGTPEQQAYLNEHYHILYDCAKASNWGLSNWITQKENYHFPDADEMDFTVHPDVYVGD